MVAKASPVLNPYLPIIALLLALTGCATVEREPGPPAPPPPAAVSADTWQRVDDDIGAASRAAAADARDFARAAVEKWREQVRERTESDFIPWFASYWTQQWLSVKVAWYKLNAGDEPDAAARRLAAYLQAEYQERVLAPAALEIDPEQVRTQTTRRYARRLGEQLPGIAKRHGVPAERFAERLAAIPAVALGPPASRNASLRQIVEAEPVDRQTAYAALLAHLRETAPGAGTAPVDARMSPMAQRASDQMTAKLTASGGAGAAAAIFGGIAGMMITLGAAGISAIAHESGRPAMEAQLRDNLEAAVDEMSRSLLEDARSGVLAGVYHIAGQVEERLAQPVVQAVKLEAAPQERPLPEQ